MKFCSVFELKCGWMLLENVQSLAGLLRDREWHKSEEMGIVMLGVVSALGLCSLSELLADLYTHTHNLFCIDRLSWNMKWFWTWAALLAGTVSVCVTERVCECWFWREGEWIEEEIIKTRRTRGLEDADERRNKQQNRKETKTANDEHIENKQKREQTEMFISDSQRLALGLLL